MSDLRTHDLNEVCSVDPKKLLVPGIMVFYHGYYGTLGVIVALDPHPNEWTRQPQVTVLWSKAPPRVNFSIHTSRLLGVRWSPDMTSLDIERIDATLVSEIVHGHLTPYEAKRNDADIVDIQCTHYRDGSPSDIRIDRHSTRQHRHLFEDRQNETNRRF